MIIRKNKLGPVFKILAAHENLSNILFMGNNALAFGEYLEALPRDKLLFASPREAVGFVNMSFVLPILNGRVANAEPSPSGNSMERSGREPQPSNPCWKPVGFL